MNPTQARIMGESKLVASGAAFTSRQLAQELGLPTNTAMQMLTQLSRDGFLRHQMEAGDEESTYYRARLSLILSRRPWTKALAQELEQARA